MPKKTNNRKVSLQFKFTIDGEGFGCDYPECTLQQATEMLERALACFDKIKKTDRRNRFTAYVDKSTIADRASNFGFELTI